MVSFDKKLIAWQLLACLTVTWLLCADRAYSSDIQIKPELSVPNALEPNKDSLVTVPFAHVDTSAPELAIAVDGVKINITHSSKVDDITISSSCPAHWNVTGHVIRQVAFANASKGISLRADSMGSVLMVNGRMYLMPTQSNGAIHGLNISQDKGKVMINGQAVEPIAGSDVPGPCGGIDILEVQVPLSYRGGLIVSTNGASNVSVDSWQGGSTIFNLNGTTSLSCGNMQGLTKAIVDVHGSGNAVVNGLSAQALVVNVDGTGSLTVNNGNAQISNATISGTGNIKLQGKFKNLKKAVSGTGSIQVVD